MQVDVSFRGERVGYCSRSSAEYVIDPASLGEKVTIVVRRRSMSVNRELIIRLRPFF